MFLVESNAIPDLTFRGWGLLVQALAIEFVPEFRHCLFCDLLRYHPDISLIPSTEFLHVHQIHLQLLISVEHQGGCGREAITSGFM